MHVQVGRVPSDHLPILSERTEVHRNVSMNFNELRHTQNNLEYVSNMKNLNGKTITLGCEKLHALLVKRLERT